LLPSSGPAQFWIFAGPNGSGKSTAYAHLQPERRDVPFWIVNPDLLTLQIQEREGLTLDEANIQAVTRLEAWLEATIRVHRSLGVETVLSTPKYRRVVSLAKQHGFAIRLVYVVLNSPELNVERVRARVARGGHDVPEHKIIERYWRSLEQLPWFLRHADTAQVLDNSGETVELIAEKVDGMVRLHRSTIPAVAAAIKAAVSE